MISIDKNKDIVIESQDVYNHTIELAEESYIGLMGFLNTLTIKDSPIFSFEEYITRDRMFIGFHYTEDDPDSFLILYSLLYMNIEIYEMDIKRHSR